MLFRSTIEKKGSVISQPINQRVVDNVMRYKEGLKQGHFDPKDYNGVMEFMRRTGGYKFRWLRARIARRAGWPPPG